MTGGPTISVVTVAKNAGDTIGDTLDSVLAQTYPRTHTVVLDGESSDNTWDEVVKREHRLTTVRRALDAGIYDAMNQAVSLSTGDYILFLNANDTLVHPRTLETVVSAMGDATADVYFGGVLWTDPDAGWSRVRRVARASAHTLYRGSLPHQGMLIRRDAFQRVGTYDLAYTLLADYEWTLRALLEHRCRFVPIDVVVSVFLEGGRSAGHVSPEQTAEERARARAAHYSPARALACRARTRIAKAIGR